MREYFKNYFNSSGPICSEERQYTLFLYNRLLSIMKKTELDREDSAILKTCGITGRKITIISTAFEASYMRDIFSQERYDRNGEKQIDQCISPGSKNPSFNEMLFSFVNRDYQVPTDHVYLNRNFGKGKIFKVADSPEKQPPQMIDILKRMMNEKPAISVFYEKSRKKYLRLLDCKYLSGESMNKGITQSQLLELISRFLCERIFAESGIKVNPENGIVYFVSEKNKNWKAITASSQNCIRIEQLIPSQLIPNSQTGDD